MGRIDNLQVQIPKAMDMGNGLVAARQFDLNIYANVENYYQRLSIGPVSIIPNFIPVQVWVFRNDVELGRYSSQNGRIEFSHSTGADSPITLRIYNLSIDAAAMLSISVEGELYNAF
jgi:hypothetical protein